MDKNLHLKLETVEELRARIEVLNQIIVSSAWYILKEEPYGVLPVLREARLWDNGENPLGGVRYPMDTWTDYDAEKEEETD